MKFGISFHEIYLYTYFSMSQNSVFICTHKKTFKQGALCLCFDLVKCPIFEIWTT